MEVYALIGKSGTGKSYQAQTVSGKYGIDYILDDGLLISRNKILAGKSAKREKTKFAAVRRAIYTDFEHRKNIINALEEYIPDKLLIIGTSEHMIHKITKTLGINRGYKLIKIDEISTQEEIEIALKTRRTMGMHVIPVPTFEIKRAFSGYFIDSIKQFSKRNEKYEEVTENTVVRPTFSYLGSFDIKDSVIKEIVTQSANSSLNIMKLSSVSIKKEKDGIKITATVTIKLAAPIPEIINQMVMKIKNDVEFMTGINVLELNSIVKGISL